MMIAPEHYDYLLFGSKVCPMCGASLPACSDFFGREKNSRDDLKSECRSCLSKISKASYQRCREKRLANQRAYRQRRAVTQ